MQNIERKTLLVCLSWNDFFSAVDRSFKKMVKSQIPLYNVM